MDHNNNSDSNGNGNNGGNGSSSRNENNNNNNNKMPKCRAELSHILEQKNHSIAANSIDTFLVTWNAFDPCWSIKAPIFHQAGKQQHQGPLIILKS
jgi:hypothetical protein